MKLASVLTLLLLNVYISNAQTSTTILEGTFKKRKIGMSTRPYKPDVAEKSFYDSSIKSALPSRLVNNPEKYKGKLIHLLGIVDSVYMDGDSTSLRVLLQHKYWDYLEDYSIQDEVMFVSPKGDGKFEVKLSGLSQGQAEIIKNYPTQRKLFLIYGFNEGFGPHPIIAAQLIKVIDYKFYSTKIFSYEAKRDAAGVVEVDKNGSIEVVNFRIMRLANRGQNK